MSFRSRVGILLALCISCLWSTNLYAQEAENPPTERQSEQSTPILLELTLDERVDTSSPLTISLGIDVIQNVFSSAELTPGSTISMQITPAVLDVSPGISVVINSMQPLVIDISMPEMVSASDLIPGGDSPTFAGTVNRDANLRMGPGTAYEVGGQVALGATVTVVGRNSAGDWYQLEDGSWIAAFLVDGLPDSVSEVDNTAAASNAGLTPAGWTRYELISSGTSFAVPPEWIAEDQGKNSITFVPASNVLMGLNIAHIGEAVPTNMEEDELIRRVKLSVIDGLDEIKIAFLKEGTFDVANRPVYVTGRATLPDEAGSGAVLAMLIPHDKDGVILMYWTMASRGISDDTLNSFAQLANSFIFSDSGEVSVDPQKKEDSTEDSTPVTTASSQPSVSQSELGDNLPNRYMIGNAVLSLPEPTSEDFDVIPVGRAGKSLFVFIRNNTDETYKSLGVDVVVRAPDGSMLAVDEAIGFRPARVGPGEVAFERIFFSDVELPDDVQFDFDVNASLLAEGKESGDLVVQEHTRIDDRFVGMLTNPGQNLVSGPIEVVVLCFEQDGSFLNQYYDFTTKNEVEPGAAIPFQVDLRGTCPQYLLYASGFTR